MVDPQLIAAALPEQLRAMLGGPGRFRFIVQPLVAVLLGFRDGRLDARAGRPPYLIAAILEEHGRRATLRSGVGAFIKPFAIAVLLDMILQFYILRDVRIWSALIVGALLIAIPYSLARSLANRVVRRRSRARP